MTARERFVIKKDAEEERACGREILKETDGGELEMARGVSKPDEGNGSDNAGADQHGRQPPTGSTKSERAAAAQIEQVSDGEGNEQDRLKKQSGNRAGA